MNFNWKIIGNQKAVEYLDKSLSLGRIANFYIFSGPEGVGKFSLASNFVTNVFLKDRPDLKLKDNFLLTNSDFYLIEREEGKKNISIDQIRQFIARFSAGSFLNSYRVAIIKDAQYLNSSSANALLKVLEEASGKTLIILTVDDLKSLPPTIVSRSQIIHLFPVKDDLIYQSLIDNFAASPGLARNLARLSDGRPGLALKFLADESSYQDYQSLLLSCLDFFSANFSDRSKIIEDMLKKNDLLEDYSPLLLWQTLIRDFIFLFYGQYDRVKNDFALERLKAALSPDWTPDDLVRKAKIIDRAQSYLNSNINLRAVLDYIAVNL